MKNADRKGGCIVAKRTWLLAALTFGVGLSATGTAAAEWPWERLRQKHECGRGDYSPLHYWAPTLYRLSRLHSPRVPMNAADRYPGLPASYQITTYPCPYAPPDIGAYNLRQPATPPAAPKAAPER
jgi:hypothetical protein